METQVKTNFEIFVDTVNMLAGSQGFYSRLKRDMLEWTEEELENAKTGLNGMPQWKDSLDCVLWLEQ